MTPLEQSIALHRAMYADELDFSPSQRTPPVAFKWDDQERAMVPDDSPLVINALTADEVTVPDSATQSTQVGMPMSGRMYRYLVGPSPHTPWAASLMALRSWCRKVHRRRYHSTEADWHGSLCHRMVYLVIVEKWSVQRAGFLLSYTDPESILRDALHYIEERIDDFRVAQEHRAKEDEGLALTCACGHGWSRHDNPSELFRCGACECRRYHANSKAA